MRNKVTSRYFVKLFTYLCIGIAVHYGNAAEGSSTTELRRYYHPGTVQLDKNDMLVIALVTGHPLMQPGQASACRYVA